MKPLRLLAISLFFICSQAYALPWTWTDTIDPADVKIPPTYSFSFNLGDGPTGFRPLIDSISSYSISFNLYDDQDPFFVPLEAALIDMPGILGDRVFFSMGGAEFGGMSIEGWLELSFTGQLDVSIASVYGDFMFANATLSAEGNRVPEPGILGLFGIALAAGTFATRRKA